MVFLEISSGNLQSIEEVVIIIISEDLKFLQRNAPYKHCMLRLDLPWSMYVTLYMF